MARTTKSPKFRYIVSYSLADGRCYTVGHNKPMYCANELEALKKIYGLCEAEFNRRNPNSTFAERTSPFFNNIHIQRVNPLGRKPHLKDNATIG